MSENISKIEKGFYHHYKHDKKGSVNNYAYEVIGVGFNTENENEVSVVYRALYESKSYRMGKLLSLRPIDIFNGFVEKDNQKIPRFTKITDQKTISELQDIKNAMYPE